MQPQAKLQHSPPTNLPGLAVATLLRRVIQRTTEHLRPSDFRLYRDGVYPPLRGTGLSLDSDEFLLYTRGSVPFFQTYPGMYVPRPTNVRIEDSEQTHAFLAQEILALAKLNWNTTQFDGGIPITLRASREVGYVLRFCAEDQIIAPRYELLHLVGYFLPPSLCHRPLKSESRVTEEFQRRTYQTGPLVCSQVSQDTELIKLLGFR